MKRGPADDWFSKTVRARDRFTCQKCQKTYPENHAGLHCSHNYSRRHRTIRWDLLNALALCYSCHEWFGGNPVESGKWLEEKLGVSAIGLLQEKKDSGVKVPKLEEKEIAKFYRDQYRENMKLPEAEREWISYQ